MIVIERVIGNLKRDRIWQQRLKNVNPDLLMLSQWEAQKSRCRKTTRDGQDVGISLDRDRILADGDILLWDEANNHAIVVQMSLRDVMVIHLHPLSSMEVNAIMKICFELGHALGNQHWKAVIKRDRIYVPLTVATSMMDSVMKTHGFYSLPYAFVTGESILSELSQPEARLLFGGAEDAGTHIHVADTPSGQPVIKLK